MLTPLGQSEGVISVEDWAEIRRLHKSEKMAIKAIARQLGVARNGQVLLSGVSDS